MYKNKVKTDSLDEERDYFIKNKMMKYYKLIKEKENPNNSTIFMSDNKGEIYTCEFTKDNEVTKITNFGQMCNDSKYILVDVIKSAKYDYYFSLNLNPCINIFKIKDNQNKKEIEILQHINLKNNTTKSKYHKLFELSTENDDYLFIFGEEKIELWRKNKDNNNTNTNNIQYQREYILNINNNINVNNEDNFIKNKITNVFQVDDERLVVFNRDKLEFIYIKITKVNNNNSTIIEIINKVKVKGINGQFEKINSFFIDKDYMFLGLADSLVLVSVPYGEIIQIYRIGKVIEMKIINEQKDIVVYVETNENEYYFIKYKLIEYHGLIEEKRMKYDQWVYKFDFTQNGEIIAIYDIKGFITLLNMNN